MAFCKHCNEYIAAHNIAACPLCGNPLPENAPSENVLPENTLPESTLRENMLSENEVKNPVSDSQMPKQSDNAADAPAEPTENIWIIERMARLVVSLLISAISGFFSLFIITALLYVYDGKQCGWAFMDTFCIWFSAIGIFLIPALLVLTVIPLLPERVLKKRPLWMKIWLLNSLGYGFGLVFRDTIFFMSLLVVWDVLLFLRVRTQAKTSLWIKAWLIFWLILWLLTAFLECLAIHLTGKHFYIFFTFIFS